MTLVAATARWHAAAGQAAQSTLAERWRRTTQELLSIREQYLALRDSTQPNVAAIRKAAQRMHDLDQLRSVLTRELEGLPG